MPNKDKKSSGNQSPVPVYKVEAFLDPGKARILVSNGEATPLMVTDTKKKEKHFGILIDPSSENSS